MSIWEAHCNRQKIGQPHVSFHENSWVFRFSHLLPILDGRGVGGAWPGPLCGSVLYQKCHGGQAAARCEVRVREMGYAMVWCVVLGYGMCMVTVSYCMRLYDAVCYCVYIYISNSCNLRQV